MPMSPQKRRQEIYDHLIGNCGCDEEPQFTEEDIEVLNKFSIEQLDRLIPEEKDLEEAVANEEEPVEEVKVPEAVANEQVVEPAAPKEFDESALPDEIKKELEFARNTLKEQKDVLIDKIVSNKKCEFTKEELSSKDPQELQKLVSLLGNSEPAEEPKPKKPLRLGGHAEVTGNETTSVPDVLELPVMNFGSDN